MSLQSDYYARIAPYAEQASKATGIPSSAIAAQWAHESGYGRSRLAQLNNQAGIMTNGTGRQYSDMAAFTADYVKAANQKRYDAARTSDPLAALAALGAGGWDAAGYRGPQGLPGELVQGVWRNDQAAMKASVGQIADNVGGTFSGKNVADIVTILPGLVVNPGGTARRAGEAAGDVAQAAAEQVAKQLPFAEQIGKALGTITSLSFWRRFGIALVGLLLLLIAVAVWRREASSSI